MQYTLFEILTMPLTNYFEGLDDELTRDVFTAMERDQYDKDYLANVAMAALRVVDKAEFLHALKSKSKSDAFRELGNRSYQTGFLQKALIMYNRALAYAPNGSLSLKLAYSNRSAILFSAELFKACEKDCTTALGIDCPTTKNVIDKIRRRKFQALGEMRKPDQLAQHNQKIMKSADEYYKLKSRHPEIPCASADVEVIMESGVPKVIAKRDIPAGELVALEKAFVSWAPADPDQYFSCYHCRKLDLNLFPCSGCVAALFCSKQCEESCMAEYHSLECQFIGNVIQIDNDDRWLFKAMLKLKNMCASWEDLIAMSYDLGTERMKRDTLNDIFDGKKPTSLLSYNNSRHFLDAAVYQRSFLCGLFLSNIKKMHSFLPEDLVGKMSAMKALARIMMHFSLYHRATSLTLITDVNSCDRVGAHSNGHRGVFPFIGKLKHCCVPNLQKVTINDSMALISLKTIKAGTELTVTHVFHWLENGMTRKERKVNVLLECQTICTCFVCNATPKELEKKKKEKLPEHLGKAVLECLDVEFRLVMGTPVKECFDNLYRVLSSIHHVPFSEDYELVYRRLGCLHAYVLNKKLQNMVLALDM